ncbi:hypothetical protein HG531_007426 [Fusarium graminearum]|nr:hypothetical protein HG531_007426 [Fusarium graminearum]
MSPLIVSSSDEDPELPLKDLRFGPLTRGSPRSVEDLNYRASHLIQTVILRMADRNVSEAVDTVRRAVFSVDASIEQGPRNTGFLVTCQFDQTGWIANKLLRGPKIINLVESDLSTSDPCVSGCLYYQRHTTTAQQKFAELQGTTRYVSAIA